jgi:adenylate kinase family enzyme
MLISNRFEDEITPKSLKKALTNAKKGQGVFIWLPPSEIAQIKGLDRKLNSDESLFYTIQVVDVLAK